MGDGMSDPDRLARENETLRRRLAAFEVEAQLLLATLHGIGDAVVATDATGSIVRMNPAAERLTGWSEAEARGRPTAEVFRIIDEATRAEVESPVARVLREGALVGLANHTVLVARDGTERPIADSGAPIRDEDRRVAGVVLVFRDQTDERRARSELERTEALFRTFFTNAPIGTSMTTPDGRLLRVNAAFGAMLGYSVEELQTLSFPSITHPDDVAESRECIRALLAGERDTWEMDKRYLAKDGRLVWTHVTTRLQRDALGQPLHFLTHVQDITERRKTEAALQQSEEKYRGLFDNAEVGMYRSRLDGSGIIALNQRLADMFGCTKEELLSGPATMRWADPEARDAMVRLLRERGVLREHELDIVTKSGAVRTLLTSLKLYPREGYLEGSSVDITELKQTERELREARATLELRVQERTAALDRERRFLRQVIDTVPAFICVKTEDGPYALANVSLAGAYGTNPSGVEGKSDQDFSPTPEEAAAFRKDDLEVIRGARTKAIAEERITYADGTVHWLSTTKIPLLEADGSCSKLLAVAMDITELREHREHLRELVDRRTAELRESHASLVEAQSVAHLGSWDWDVLKDEIVGSAEFHRLFERGPEQLAHFPQFLDRLHPDDRDRVQRDVTDALQQRRPFDTDYRVKLQDGTWRDINARGRAFTDPHGTPLRLVGTCLDITERKRALESLRRIEWMLTCRASAAWPSTSAPSTYGDLTALNSARLILDSVGPKVLQEIVTEFLDLMGTSSAVYEKNGDYALGIFSSGWCRFLDEASRRLCDTPDNREALGGKRWLCHESCWTDCSKRAIETGEPVDLECNGGIHLHAEPIRAGGEVVGAINVGYGDPPRDEAKLRELGLRYGVDPEDLRPLAHGYESRPSYVVELAKRRLRSAAKLIGEIVERHRQEEAQRRANADLVRSNEELEQFAYVASHDLQEPLRMVASFTQLLGERYKGKLDAKADSYISYAVDGARRMQGLVNDLLAFSRVGTRAKALEPVQSADVAAEVLKGLGKLVAESGADIRVAPLPRVLADRTQLGQVFQNLIENAIKFRGAHAPVVEISARKDGADWVFEVKDNGLGIDPKHFDRIFVIFQRLHDRESYPGSGIGLSIVKKIVERHGGRIWVLSTPGAGARFLFTLRAPGTGGRNLD